MKPTETWIVGLPIVGEITMELELPAGATKEEALEAGWNKYGETSNPGEDDSFDVAWETVEAVTTGNVCHAPLNVAYADCVDRRKVRFKP